MMATGESTRACRAATIWMAMGFMLAGMTFSLHAFADSEFREKLEYIRIDSPQPTHSEANRVEVVELFFYACPHCNRLRPKMKAWRENRAADVNFRRIPAIVGPIWIELARAYYVAKELNVLDRIDGALYDAIHNKKKQYYNKISIQNFFMAQGVPAADFLRAYDSNSVAEQVSEARVMTVKYGLRGVPSIVVNGKYLTAPFIAGTQEKMFEVMDFLVAKEMQAND